MSLTTAISLILSGKIGCSVPKSSVTLTCSEMPPFFLRIIFVFEFFNDQINSVFSSIFIDDDIFVENDIEFDS